MPPASEEEISRAVGVTKKDAKIVERILKDENDLKNNRKDLRYAQAAVL